MGIPEPIADRTETYTLISMPGFHPAIKTTMKGPRASPSSIPSPALVISEHNSVFITLAPTILTGLVIQSGHNCPYCDPLHLRPFSALTIDSLALVRQCIVVGFQGSGVM